MANIVLGLYQLLLDWHAPDSALVVLLCFRMDGQIC